MLREAVLLVEHHRVARMRRGPGGGLLISEPDASPATRAVVIYLEYLGTTLGDLLNAPDEVLAQCNQPLSANPGAVAYMVRKSADLKPARSFAVNYTD